MNDAAPPLDAIDALDADAVAPPLDAADGPSSRDASPPDVATDTGPDAIADAPRDAPSTCPAPPAGLPSGALTRFARNPLLRNGPETYDALKTGPRVVLRFGPGDYRMWYEAVAMGATTVAYATSTDGLTWTKRGVVMRPMSAWEGDEVSPNSILVEGGVFRLWYHGGGNSLPNRNIGYATSPDGMTWTRRPMPVLTVGPTGSFDASEVAEPRVFAMPGGGYRMYFTGQSAANRQALGVADSPDGVTWTKSPRNPIVPEARWGNFWGGAIFFERGVWFMWHGVQSGTASSLHFMWSTDGFTWVDGPSNPVLVQNPDMNAADYGLVGDSVSGYRDGSEYRIMYTGFNWNLFGTLGRFEGICMATVAADPRCP